MKVQLYVTDNVLMTLESDSLYELLAIAKRQTIGSFNVTDVENGRAYIKGRYCADRQKYVENERVKHIIQ